MKIQIALFAVFVATAFSQQIPEWDKEQVDREMDAIPWEWYSTANIEKYENAIKELGNICIKVEILDNKIYINNVEQFIHEHTDELGPTLKMVSRDVELPNCVFLYMPASFYIQYIQEKIGLDLNDVPLLVGDKRKSDLHTILFIDPISLWREGDWSLRTATLDVNKFIGLYPWKQKADQLFWRGTLSDLEYYAYLLPKSMLDKKQYSPRLLLHQLSKEFPLKIDAKLTGMIEHFLPLAHELGLDTTEFVSRQTILKHLPYKYQIVLDGTISTYPGYAWRLLSDCCVFKVDSQLYQWFYEGLIPWVHYIPVNTDLSDLMEKLTWAQENDEKAQEIAINGRHFALEYLQLQHFWNHALYVLNKYSSYQSRADRMREE